MVRSGLNPSQKDIKNFLLSGLVVGAAYAAFKEVTSFQSILILLFFGLITVFSREIGQRIVGQWMDAQVDLEISMPGTTVTIIAAILSYISTLNLAFVVPVFSKFSGESYEQWGKSVDAIWAKRKYWIVSSGIATLLTAWIVSYSAGITQLAEMIALFTFFQLLPLDAEKGISGKLDGVHIILWSGFMWLIFMGLTIIG